MIASANDEVDVHSGWESTYVFMVVGTEVFSGWKEKVENIGRSAQIGVGIESVQLAVVE